MLSSNLILIALPVIHALVLQKPHESNDYDRSHSNVRPSQTWYHPSDHPVHALFKRASEENGTTYVPVGSPGTSNLG